MGLKKLKHLVALCIISLTIQSCATPAKSTGAGALVGGIAGAGVGAIADPGSQGENRFRNVVIGTAIGAGVGAGAGFILGENAKEDRDSAREQGKEQAEADIKKANNQAANISGQAPRLIPARTEAHWVPDQSRGNIFVPGHFEYEIVEAARWEVTK